MKKISIAALALSATCTAMQASPMLVPDNFDKLNLKKSTVNLRPPSYCNPQTYTPLGGHFDTAGERTFVFSPRYKMWAAYDSEGYRIAGGIANGGSDFCTDLKEPCHTPAGVFRILFKRSVNCVSRKFPLGRGGAAMPYCMFFHGGYAIHGSDYISKRNGSHGCIRVQTMAAKWLNHYFLSYGTKVVVLPY